MDSDKRSRQVERLGVVETGRRRRWTEDEKLKIVLGSLQTPRQISATARRYIAVAADPMATSVSRLWRDNQGFFRIFDAGAGFTDGSNTFIVSESQSTP